MREIKRNRCLHCKEEAGFTKKAGKAKIYCSICYGLLPRKIKSLLNSGKTKNIYDGIFEAMDYFDKPANRQGAK